MTLSIIVSAFGLSLLSTATLEGDWTQFCVFFILFKYIIAKIWQSQ